MKKAFKFIGGFLGGACIGFGGVTGAKLLFFGESFDNLANRFTTISCWEIVGIFLMSILLLLLALFLQVILHEGGHLVFGLATGYRFVSFRIFNLTFIRKDNKLCIKRFSIAGTGGQCLLVPPEKPLERVPTILYNLGGVLTNLLTSIIALSLLITINGIPFFPKFGLTLVTIIGLIMVMMNGIPMRINGICNDAGNIRLLLKNKKSKQALITQLRINALVQEGMRPKDMSEEWFRPPEGIQYKDTLQVATLLIHIARLQDQKKWEEAYEALQEVAQHEKEVGGLLICEVKCELLFMSLVTGRMEQAEKAYTDELKEYINQYKNVMSSKQRILCALALYREKDYTKAKEIYTTVCQQKEKYLMQGEVLSDIAQMKAILAISPQKETE